MRILVLGSAAGGGYPQWNCRCPVCALAWDGSDRVSARSQSSIAVSADGDRWMLLNASPDLRQQLLGARALHPRGAMRQSPIAAVFLTNGDVDHIVGLLSLRERQSFVLYGTAATLSQVAHDRIFGVLDPDFVRGEAVRLDERFDTGLGFFVRPFSVPGKVPLYLERGEVEIGAETEATIGVEIGSGDRRILYIPGCARLTPALLARIEGVDLLLFDGTTFTNDEMVALNLSPKTAERMGHLPIGGATGSLAGLAAVQAGAKVYIHINNTNPVLVEGSPERAAVESAGWQVAFDGMEFTL